MLIPPGFIAVFARFKSAIGHPCQNVCGYAITDVWTQAATDAVSADLAGSYKQQLNTGGSFDGVHILVGNDGDDLAFDSVSGAGAGTRSGALQAPQVQGLLRKRTGLAGRKGRGRMFIPDMFESQVDDSGGVDATGLARLNDIAQTWNSALGVGVLIDFPVILHSDATVPTRITNVEAEHKVATLRRRFPR